MAIQIVRSFSLDKHELHYNTVPGQHITYELENMYWFQPWNGSGNWE